MSDWVPVLGTLGGVAVGGVITYAIERARWKQQERTRWYDRGASSMSSFSPRRRVGGG
jgi:hypothetical protein